MDMTPIGRGTTITSRELSQDAGRAKKQALNGPVFITDRGRPAHVLLSIEEYRRLAGIADRPFVSIAASLAQSGPGGDFDFEVERDRTIHAFREIEW